MNTVGCMIGLTAAALGLVQAARAGDPPVPLRVACVGDSITQGDGLADPAAQSYPSVLARLLGDGYDVRNLGVPGATLLRDGSLPYRDTPAFPEIAAFAPHRIVLMLGTNDSKMRNRKERDAFADDLRDMLDHFASLPGPPRVWVCLPPPLVGLLRYPNQATLVEHILPAIRRVAAEKGVEVIDIFSTFAGREDRLPDGVHPDAEGAELIARTVLEALSRASKGS